MMNNNQAREENFSFNSNTSPPLKDLVGKVITKETKKVYAKDSAYFGNIYLKLKVINEQEQKKNLFVYSNIVGEVIFHQIATSNCIDKRYYFTCQKKGRRLILHSWRELTSNNEPILFTNKEPILNDHVKKN